MTAPHVTRPLFPPGYVDNPKRLLAWEQVEQTLAGAIHYWLGSVRPNSRPHAVPKWAVWVAGHIYFDGSPQTRHARNIAQNPFVSIHLEDGQKPVILEGTAKEITPSPELAATIARAYSAKYAALGYAPKPNTWDAGGLFEIEPHVVLAWTSFAIDPTKFVFSVPSD